MTSGAAASRPRGRSRRRRGGRERCSSRSSSGRLARRRGGRRRGRRDGPSDRSRCQKPAGMHARPGGGARRRGEAVRRARSRSVRGAARGERQVGRRDPGLSTQRGRPGPDQGDRTRRGGGRRAARDPPRGRAAARGADEGPTQARARAASRRASRALASARGELSRRARLARARDRPRLPAPPRRDRRRGARRHARGGARALAAARPRGGPADRRARATTRPIARGSRILGVQLALLEDPDLLEATEALLARGQERRVRVARGVRATTREARGGSRAPLMRERAATSATSAGASSRCSPASPRSRSRCRRARSSSPTSSRRPRSRASTARAARLLHHDRRLDEPRGNPRPLDGDPRGVRDRRGARSRCRTGRAVVIDGDARAPPGQPGRGARVTRCAAHRRPGGARRAWTRPRRSAGPHAGRPPRRGGREHREREGRARGGRRRRRGRRAPPDRVPLRAPRGGADARTSRPPSTAPSREALGKDRPFVVRTLDVGGDKPLPYLPLPKEAEPVPRAARHPRQPRAPGAVPRAAPRDPARGAVRRRARHVPDGRDARRGPRRRRRSSPRSSAPSPRAVKVGMMIEVPSAAVMAERARARGRLLLHRHQRSHPVHAGDGPRPPAARAAGRRAAPGGAAHDRA